MLAEERRMQKNCNKTTLEISISVLFFIVIEEELATAKYRK